jgi:hypothetical protein
MLHSSIPGDMIAYAALQHRLAFIHRFGPGFDLPLPQPPGLSATEFTMLLRDVSFANTAAVPPICHDQIEQQIIRSYVQLALTPNQANGHRTATLAQFGAIEVRLTELSQEEGAPLNVPPFWLEIYSHTSNATIDSCGCFEFDEDELSAAVELVTEARQRHQLLN